MKSPSLHQRGPAELTAGPSLRHLPSHSISERLAKFLLESSAEGRIANEVVRTKLVLTHEDISNSSVPAGKR
jgi:hypothetical protein